MRADVYLVSFGFCESRSRASKLICDGLVFIDGKKTDKPSCDVDESVFHDVKIEKHDEFVGRGALKLQSAINEFSIDVSGMRCIDVGASTGGFTQYLLLCGAESVVAVDSGRGQLHKSLLGDARVRSVEGFNARNLNADEFGVFDCAVMDVSFISQTLIISSLASVICDGGIFISLIKPQFEAGRSAVGKNGIVRSATDREKSIIRVIDTAKIYGFSLNGIIVSPIKGGDGNTEFLAYFKKDCNSGEISEQMKNRISRLCRG